MGEFFAEFLGTFLLIVLGNGVVANVNLDRTHSHGAGWIVITAGWGMAVFVAVFATQDISGAHLNPAVTLGLALSGLFGWAKVVPFVLAQMAGAMLGAFTVYFFFADHFRATRTPQVRKHCFCTAPAIRNYRNNFFSELVGTFILVLAVLLIHLPSLEIAGVESAKVGLGSLEALPVGLLVFAIGLSLGVPRGMPSIRHVIWDRALCIVCCPFRRRTIPTGPMPGSPSWGLLPAPAWRCLYIWS